MSSGTDFKVIIVGAGIAGLCLANMLEKFDINYVILEAHSEVAPKAGAGIALLPNGLRILDQIGCYDQILKLPQQCQTELVCRDAKGKRIFSIPECREELERRHGYCLLFFDRQQLLQSLYDQLRHKDRILLNTRVTKVKHVAQNSVQVTTGDGETFKGTILVAADGIHSIMREEMVRIGNKLDPGYFPPGEADRVPCYYRCSFGFAQNVPHFVKGEHTHVKAKDYSVLVASGPENKVYWFIFQRLPRPMYGKDIPKYTKEDEDKFMKENWNLPVTDKITFGDLYSRKLSSALTPIHEVVFEKWFFGRIITIGDSAHKPNPLTGQGGNSALETAAALINEILRMRDSRSNGLDNLTDQEVRSIFQEVQSTRKSRVQMLVTHAHDEQALSAYEKPLMSVLVWYGIGRFLGNDALLNLFSNIVIGATKIGQLPTPKRSRLIPFVDELPEKPINKTSWQIVRGTFVLGMLWLFWLANMSSPVHFNEGESSSAPELRLGHQFNGTLVQVPSFPNPLLGEHQSFQAQIAHLSLLSSWMLMNVIDGYRLGNQATSMAVPSLILGAAQVWGLSRTAPFFAALGVLQGYELPTGRSVKPDIAKAILPALALGYVVPTILKLTLPTSNGTGWQDLNTLWKVSPVTVCCLISAFAAAVPGDTSRQVKDKQHLPHQNTDVAILKSVYTCAFLVQATIHIAAFAYAYYHPDISVAGTFLNLLSPTTWSHSDIATIACSTNNLYSIWNLRRQGYIRSGDAIKAAVALCVGQLVVGPGAAWAGLAFWREDVIAGIKRD